MPAYLSLCVWKLAHNRNISGSVRDIRTSALIGNLFHNTTKTERFMS